MLLDVSHTNTRMCIFVHAFDRTVGHAKPVIRVPAFWGLLGLDALCVGGGVVLIPYAAKYLGSGELAMILLGEIAAAQILLYIARVEELEMAKVCGGLLLLGVLMLHEWAAGRAQATSADTEVAAPHID